MTIEIIVVRVTSFKPKSVSALNFDARIIVFTAEGALAGNTQQQRRTPDMQNMYLKKTNVIKGTIIILLKITAHIFLFKIPVLKFEQAK